MLDFTSENVSRGGVPNLRTQITRETVDEQE